MRLLKFDGNGKPSLTEELYHNIPAYAILSHTWGADSDEVSFDDIENDQYSSKIGFAKVKFCGQQAKKDGINYFWVDTCCIDKRNSLQLAEAITSMFRWYQEAAKCYVYLSDVKSAPSATTRPGERPWQASFERSRWFTRGWTLQELLAPKVVEFYSQDELLLGDRYGLKEVIHRITSIPIAAMEGKPLEAFTINERFQWATLRDTKRTEDKAYCLQGILGVYIPPMYGEGGNASVRLREEVEKRSGKPIDKLWKMPRSPDPHFAGKEDLIQELNRAIRDKLAFTWMEPQYCRVIYGVEGIGKSEICLQLAPRLRYLFCAVMWVDGRTKVSTERSFLKIARDLRKSATDWRDGCRAIADLPKPWLLFLDNADASDIDYEACIPKSNLGVVIITKRDLGRPLPSVSEPIQLTALKTHEAKSLLLRTMSLGDTTEGQNQTGSNDADRVIHLLEGHPFALKHAAAHISMGYRQLNAYSAVYEQHRQLLSGIEPDLIQTMSGVAYTALDMSVIALSRDTSQVAKDALELLYVLAACARDPIPFYAFQEAKRCATIVSVDSHENTNSCGIGSLLTTRHAQYMPGFLGMDSKDASHGRSFKAAELLQKLCLVQVEKRDGFEYVSIQSMVHKWLRKRQSSETVFKPWLQAGCILGFSTQAQRMPFRQFRGLEPHFEAFTTSAATHLSLVGDDDAELSSLTVRVLLRCAWILTDLSSHSEVAVCLSGIFSHLKLNRSKIEPAWIDVYALTGWNLKRQHKPSDAVFYLEMVQEFNSKSIWQQDEYRMSCVFELAQLYRRLGRSEEAIRLLEDLSSHLTPQNLCSARHELACIHRELDNHPKAIKLLEEVVTEREKTMHEDHSALLESQYELAFTYKQHNQPRKALPLFEKIVRARERIMGKQHPELLLSLHQLAMSYRRDGQYDRARNILEKVHDVLIHGRNEEDLQRLTVQHDLALIYLSTRQNKEALGLLNPLVSIRERICPEGDKYLLLSQRELARAYYALGDSSKAIDLLESVLKIKKEILPSNSQLRLTFMENLALYLWEMQRSTRSAKLVSEVLDKYTQMVPTNDPKVKAARDRLMMFRSDGGSIGNDSNSNQGSTSSGAEDYIEAEDA